MSLLADADTALSPAEFLARLRGEDPEPTPAPASPAPRAAETPAAGGSTGELSPVAAALMDAVARGQQGGAPRPATDFNDPRDVLAGVDPEALAAAAKAAAGDGPGAAARLAALYDRVEALLGPPPAEDAAAGPPPFRPRCPDTVAESGLTEDEIERLALKYMLNVGADTGRGVGAQLKLPFTIVDPSVRKLHAAYACCTTNRCV